MLPPKIQKAIEALPRTFNLDVSQSEREALIEDIKDIVDAQHTTQTPKDYGQLRDLLSQRLWRDNQNPDGAIKLGNLYSRFMSQSILKKPQALLWLLHLLSDLNQERAPEDETGSGSDEAPAPASVRSPRKPGPRATQADGAASEVPDRLPASAPAPPAPPRRGIAAIEEDSEPSDHGPADSPPTRAAAQSESQEYMEEAPYEPPAGNPTSELDLLRDLPFTLQGLSSTHFQFGTGAATLALPRNLSLPVVSLLHTLAEPSLLYRSLAEFTQSPHAGLISQSLRSAIGIELRSYLGLIASLEAEIRRTITAAGKGDAKTRETGVTLKRCVVWTRDATMGLRLMSAMAEESRSKSGGQLISLIHAYTTAHGDPFVNAFAERVLAHLARPFYAMVRQWIYDGELHDPYTEFFVVRQDPRDAMRLLEPRKPSASSVWEGEYRLSRDLVPTIVTDDLAQKVFLIGKSLNFIRHGCADSAWVDGFAKDASQELRYGDTAGLEASIDTAYKTTMARLMHLMEAKFGLSEHLLALKRYLLLGQGDFVALLMESLAPHLDRPAGSQYRHTLTAQLDHAVRGSSAAAHPASARGRLDARLLELSHGDAGWDVFTLEYKVDAPVDVVVTPWAARQYLKVFNFLWRAKRVEFALAAAWRRGATGARGVLARPAPPLAAAWQRARAGLAEMIHFVSQLQHYIRFEVIEASWTALQAALARPGLTLDGLIAAHAAYLRDITHKGLLGASRAGVPREEGFLAQLHHLLKGILAYADALDGLFSYSVADFTRRQQAALTSGGGGLPPRRPGSSAADADAPVLGDRTRRRPPPPLADPPAPGTAEGGEGTDAAMLAALQARLSQLAAEFRQRLAALLGDLLTQPDPGIRFLAMNMNFNDVYRPTRRRRGGGQGRGAEKGERGERSGEGSVASASVAASGQGSRADGARPERQ